MILTPPPHHLTFGDIVLYTPSLRVTWDFLFFNNFINYNCEIEQEKKMINMFLQHFGLNSFLKL